MMRRQGQGTVRSTVNYKCQEVLLGVRLNNIIALALSSQNKAKFVKVEIEQIIPLRENVGIET